MICPEEDPCSFIAAEVAVVLSGERQKRGRVGLLILPAGNGSEMAYEFYNTVKTGASIGYGKKTRKNAHKLWHQGGRWTGDPPTVEPEVEGWKYVRESGWSMLPLGDKEDR